MASGISYALEALMIGTRLIVSPVGKGVPSERPSS
jgi:hypothetical protein